MKRELIIRKASYSWWRLIKNRSLRTVFNPNIFAWVRTPFELTAGGVPLLRSHEQVHPGTFKDRYYNEPSRPLVCRQYRDAQMPAISKWFLPGLKSQSHPALKVEYLEQYGDHLVPVEVSRGECFNRTMMPLSMFMKLSADAPQDTNVYLAQCPIDELPPEMQADLVKPKMTNWGAKGDAYSSSIWIGRAPTYTPFHRDPNHNVLVQLAGRKVIRLAEPDVGDAIYKQAKSRVFQKAYKMDARIRGEEMMVGKERDILDKLVWRDDGTRKLSEDLECLGDIPSDEARIYWNRQSGKPPPGATAEDEQRMQTIGLANTLETTIGPGDALYIPKGWWHSVKGLGQGIVGSANWWFR
ncbi:Clavaminate synthase-like protein [Pseudovirgaria hyperparasitica]|uniref:Clavaminate synthase-like protein n=1 Tax=Pseudovirgaria hyperparasitica TaxID=470096 RepID=A0A6A6WHC7_9PEZI|nr:Clavaminate synthase-like protein [Pseudovirgaria hyperparasitica]KAF2761495.1 Clavaminate synthase-like protein [Pseudovirgaria hyperparasitica]